MGTGDHTETHLQIKQRVNVPIPRVLSRLRNQNCHLLSRPSLVACQDRDGKGFESRLCLQQIPSAHLFLADSKRACTESDAFVIWDDGRYELAVYLSARFLKEPEISLRECLQSLCRGATVLDMIPDP